MVTTTAFSAVLAQLGRVEGPDPEFLHLLVQRLASAYERAPERIRREIACFFRRVPGTRRSSFRFVKVEHPRRGETKFCLRYGRKTLSISGSKYGQQMLRLYMRGATLRVLRRNSSDWASLERGIRRLGAHRARDGSYLRRLTGPPWLTHYCSRPRGLWYVAAGRL